AHLEATIDFPEDDVPPADVSPEVWSALEDLEALVAGASTGIVMRQGLRTAIVGRPNVGKSSLLNALLRADRAIVTPVPGTTRDTLEEVVNVRGVPLVLTDTAGLREVPEAGDPVERMGIDRTRRALAEADLALMVFDGSEPLGPADLEVLRAVEEAAPRGRVGVVNKSDLPLRIEMERLRESLGDAPVVEASATETGGTNRLEEELAGMVLRGAAAPGQDGPMVTSLRHLDALQRAQEHLRGALGSIGAELPLPAAFVAVDLHSALNALGEITGETAGEDLLDEIFRNFCIGK
ncbi:MAG: tRNA modification GTPase, partial [Chloroflexia bacterium]